MYIPKICGICGINPVEYWYVRDNEVYWYRCTECQPDPEVAKLAVICTSIEQVKVELIKARL